VRRIALRHPALIFSIPHEICNLLEIPNGDEFTMYCEIEDKKIILQKVDRE
jgi:hypothetical protein